MQRRFWWFTTIGSCLAFVICLWAAGAQAKKPSAPFGVQKTIAIPGGLDAYDITFVDNPTKTVFVADQTNRAIDIIDARRDKLITQFVPTQDGGFVGRASMTDFDLNGPDGVLEAHNLHQLWVGDGNSRVWVIDVKNREAPQVLGVISTALPSNPTDQTRADELSYDPIDHIILIANPGDTPPYVSLIDTRSRKVVKQITFPTATNGLEQSVFDPRTRLFYLAVPEADGPGSGEVVAIDPRTMSVLAQPVANTGDCEENGMALFNARQQLLLGCSRSSGSLILDLRTGALTEITETGGSDEVWFDQHDKLYYLADFLFGFNGTTGMPSLGVIDARTGKFIENVDDGTGIPFITVIHSVAANASNNHVYVPLAPNTLPFDNNAGKGLACTAGCVGVLYGSF